jgi:hypothetical protein
MAVNDKVIHFLASCAIALALFFASGCAFAAWSLRKRLVFAGISTFLIGLFKELGDGWLWQWPWCPCSADGKDLLANILGIIVALFGVVHIAFVAQTIMAKRRIEQNAEPKGTMSTV